MFKHLVIFFSCTIVYIGAICFWINKYETYACNNYEIVTGTETKYSSFDACYVKTPDGWNRWSEYVSRKSSEFGLKDMQITVQIKPKVTQQ